MPRSSKKPLPSRSEKVLVGETFLRAKVLGIDNLGGARRVIRMSNGVSYEVTKDQIRNLVDQTLAMKEKRKAFQNIARKPNGMVEVKLGGQIRGQTKTFASMGTAMSAIDKRYNKSKIPIAEQFRQAGPAKAKNISRYSNQGDRKFFR